VPVDREVLAKPTTLLIVLEGAKPGERCGAGLTDAEAVREELAHGGIGLVVADGDGTRYPVVEARPGRGGDLGAV
jgi:hypothetical protein